jgi:hypothetical protein
MTPDPEPSAMSGVPDEPALRRRIRSTLEEAPYRPWCIHGLHEEFGKGAEGRAREESLNRLERLAEDLVREGVARQESVSAVSIGVRCEDSLFWSSRSPNTRLEEFGPEFESPTILRRLASHVTCRGL